MARVEKSVSQGGGSDVAKMRGELKRVSKRVNRRHPLFSCFLIVFALVLAIFLILLWFLASTGLIRVPGVTSLAYHQPEPYRIVEPGEFLDKRVQKDVGNIVTQRLQAGGGEIQDKTISVSLSEDSFTASLQSVVAQEADAFFEATDSQVVIDPEVGIEVFLPVASSKLDTAILAQLDLETQDGQLKTKVTELKIGSLQLPAGLANQVVKNTALGPMLEELSDQIARYAQIQEVQISKGYVSLSGELFVEVERL